MYLSMMKDEKRRALLDAFENEMIEEIPEE